MNEIVKRETDRQTDRQRQSDRDRDGETERGGQTNRQIETQLESGGDKHADKVKRREIIQKKIVESYLRANPKT